MYMCVCVCACACVCLCICINLYTQSWIHWKHKRQNFPLHSCIPIASHVHCSATRMEIGYGCRELPGGIQFRDQSLSHREGQDYDDFEWQVGGISWFRFMVLGAQRYRRAICCKTTASSKMKRSPLCHRYNLPLGEKNIICNCLQVFHCFSFISCEGIMFYFSLC